MPRLPAALLVACLALAACSGQIVPPFAAPTPVSTARAVASQEAFPLLSVETIGGECAGGACHRLINLGADGRLHEVIPKDRTVGTVSMELVDALRVEMDRANFHLIESRPFIGECPTAVDRQELVYTFHLVTGDEEIRSCKVAIDGHNPLFRAVAAVMVLAGS
jgi:hypothetical protein